MQNRFSHARAFVLLLVMGLAPGSLLAQNPLEDVLPPDIIPIVVLSGSDYEMGYQYGQQAGHMIERRRDAFWAFPWQDLSREETERQLRAIQYYAKKYTPEAIAQIRGIVAGAAAAGFDVSFADLLLLNCWLPDPGTRPFPPEAEGEVIPTKKCSVSSAWKSATKDGRLIGLDAWDDEGDAVFQVIIVAFPDEGNNYICGAHAGDIGSHFLMNNRGLFVGNSGGGNSPRAEDRDFGLSWTMSLPHLVRYANTAVEARDMLLPWHIDSPENFHFADVHGNAFVVEKTAAIQAVRKSGDFGEKDFLFSTNNYFIEEMSVATRGDFVGEHGGYGVGASGEVHGDTAIPRNMLFWDMLHNYHGHVDTEFMKMILRFPGDGPPYPPAGGWETKVLRPFSSRVAVALPDDGDEGVVYVCTGPAGRVIPTTKHPAAYPFIAGTHTFFKLTLAASPRDVVAEAKAAAKDEIASAYGAFMGMNYTDVGYAPLNELYSVANKEYYQGNNFYAQGVLSSGHDANFNLARAVTAYTRAQAHALQLYEALNPAPTSPSDLGLRPFGGDWATWETKVGRKR